MDPDISILRKTGHFYFALTRIFHTNFPHEFSTRADSSEISGVPKAHLCPFDEPRLLLSHRFLRHRYDPLPAAPDFAQLERNPLDTDSRSFVLGENFAAAPLTESNYA